MSAVDLRMSLGNVEVWRRSGNYFELHRNPDKKRGNIKMQNRRNGLI